MYYECRRDTLWWDVIEVIITHSKEVATDRGNIIGLRRVGHRTILSKTNALRGEDIEFRLNGRSNQGGSK
jgi:hypothetical protein